MFESKPKRILVPVEGALTDEMALRLACLQAKQERAEVLVLYVIEVRRNLPIDADVGDELERGEQVLEDLLRKSQHWGARVLRDHQRGYGGFVLEHQGRRIYHAGDSAYFDGFKEIRKACNPEIALLPIGAYHPESFRHLHMGPDEAIKAFRDLHARWLVPMHYGSFRLAFEDMDEPPRWLKELAKEHGLTKRLFILDEGSPRVF